MNKPEAFFVVSNWKNDICWIEDYTDRYIVYDKSDTLLAGDKVLKIDNVGYNIYDICHYIINHYDNLPELVAFLQGYPFDHCNRETFDKLIYKEVFTPLESYGMIRANRWEQRTPDGGFMEFNNSWYIVAHQKTQGTEVNRYLESYNQFLIEMFENPEFSAWIRFAPGGQYVVPKENILYYSKNFWKKIMGFVDYCALPSEAHLIERSLYTIFTNKFIEKKID